jgi:hypothetical protein
MFSLLAFAWFIDRPFLRRHAIASGPQLSPLVACLRGSTIRVISRLELSFATSTKLLMKDLISVLLLNSSFISRAGIKASRGKEEAARASGVRGLRVFADSVFRCAVNERKPLLKGAAAPRTAQRTIAGRSILFDATP